LLPSFDLGKGQGEKGGQAGGTVARQSKGKELPILGYQNPPNLVANETLTSATDILILRGEEECKVHPIIMVITKKKAKEVKRAPMSLKLSSS
jgi:hypothetical protein